MRPNILFDYTPAIFNRREVWGARGVEKVLQAILFFPHLNNITLGRIPTAIFKVTIFFQDKLITSIQPLSNHPVKNDISIYL